MTDSRPRRSWRWLALVPISLAAIGADLAVRHVAMSHWNAAHWARFSASALASVLAAACLLPITAMTIKRWPRLTRAFVVAASFAWTWNLLLSLGYFVVLDAWPVATAVQYVIHEPRSSVALALPYLAGFPLLIVVLVAAPAAAIAVWVRALALVSPPGRHRFWLMPVAALAIVIGLSLKPPTYRFSVADVHAVMLTTNLARLAVRGDALRLNKPHRMQVPALKPRPDPPNVLLIVNESLGADGIGAFGCPHPVSPQIDALADATALPAGATVVLFHYAQANASSTLVSVPTLCAGLAPDSTAVRMHAQPLLWHYAKAAGYSTFMHTPQRYEWMEFDQYLIDGTLDHVFTAESTDHALANDVGIDDVHMIDETISRIDKLLAGDAPFLGVIQFNATHKPFLPHPDKAKKWPGLRDFESDRFLNAVHYVDDLTGRVVAHLRKKGALDNTVILLTSDHGQGLTGRRIRARIHNYYDEVAIIPFLLAMPPRSGSWLKKDGRLANLRANRDRRVSNVDIVPTLLDAIGVLDQVPDAIRDHFGGHSLFRPLDPDRQIAFVNVTEYRQWSQIGMSLVVGDLKYLLYERDVGCEEAVYNWRADPAERTNLWPAMSAEQKQVWFDRFKKRPWMQHVWDTAACDR